MEARNFAELGTPVGYSHVVIARESNTAYLAGMGALGPDGTVPADADLYLQAVLTTQKILLSLRSIGASPENIMRRTTYVVDLTPAKMAIVREAYLEHFGTAVLPAATAVGVTSLAHPDMLIEVECTVLLT